MKILDIIASLDPAAGGPQHSVRSLSRIWRQMGHTVDVLTLDSPDAPFLGPELGAIALGRPHGHKTFHWRDLPAAILKTAKLLDRYDVILVHGLWNYATLLARCVLPRQKVPYFVFIHGMLDPWHKQAYPIKDLIKRAIWPFNEGALLKKARAAFFTTKQEIELADRGYLPYNLRAELIRYGCEGPDKSMESAYHDAFCVQFPELQNKKFLMFMSRIHPKKGCDTLLQALAACQAEAPDLLLVIAGPDQIGWQSSLQKQARDLGVADKIYWIGSITGLVKWGTLLACEAFILPSHGENFGIVVAEAMACAKPVLISDRVNLHDTVTRYSAGIIAPHDLNGTISLIRRYAALSRESQMHMAQNALECYQANYGIIAAAEAMIETFAAHVTAPMQLAK